MYDGSSTIQLTNNNYDDVDPQIHNGQVTWIGKNGPDYEVFLYDGVSTIQLMETDYDDYSPQIHEGQVTWYGWDGHDFEIWLYDGTTKTQLTDNEYDDTLPQLHNGEVTWHGGIDPFREIYVYTQRLAHIAGARPSAHGFSWLVGFSTEEAWVDQYLNGDTDVNDSVLRYYDQLTGTLVNTAAVVSEQFCFVYSDKIGFFTHELELGRDVDGDDRLNDFIIRYYDAATSTIVETDVVGMFPSVYIYSYGGTVSKFTLAFTALESQVGKNLNGEGDRTDRVLGYYDVLTGDVVYTDLDAHEAHVYGNFIAYDVREYEMSSDFDREPREYDRDLNDDGDINDSIIQLVEITSPL